ncbi:MAG: dockerin type I repeat-containing protein [Clostridia bacterium]|nr:dockerin type I repeat-containing protein [Clostridia bacterium]
MKFKSLLCAVLCFLLIASVLPFSVAAKEAETAPTGDYVYYIETYEQLRNHASNAQADCRYILADYIDQSDNENDLEIVIPEGAVFKLDLNGYSIQRSTQGNDCALFRIKSGGVMTINDTSDSQTGYCSFSDGFTPYSKAVFYNDGGELEINGGYYEIFSPFEQGDCSIVRTTSGSTYIYDGTFDSSSAWGGDTISVGHNAYLYEVPHVVIFGGEFYGKYSSIEVTPFDNYLQYGCLYPSVYVLGGSFYVTKESESSGFTYCNNGWGRVIVAEGTVLSKCLNQIDQRFLSGTSKKHFTQTIDDYNGGYYEVTAPPMIMSDNLDYYYRLIGLCDKEMVKSYGSSVYELHKEKFDAVLERIDTIIVSETEETSPYFELRNRTLDHQYVNWYMCDESEYQGEDTEWTHIGDAYNISHWRFDERPEEATSYIIRCVVTKSDLTTYEDVVRVYYEALEKEPEKKVIDIVDITEIDAPLEGEHPDYDAYCATQGCNVSAVKWYDVTEGRGTLMNADDVFVAGRSYRVDVLVEAVGNCTFLMSDGYNEAEGYINSVKATAYGSHDETELELGLVFPPCEENPSKPDVKGILGDANEDGTVNVKDATAIQKHLASLITLSETGLKLADADGNANVNIKDATAIQKHIAGMDTGYPIGESIIL